MARFRKSARGLPVEPSCWSPLALLGTQLLLTGALGQPSPLSLNCSLDGISGVTTGVATYQAVRHRDWVGSWAFTAAVAGTHTFTTCQSSFNTEIRVFGEARRAPDMAWTDENTESSASCLGYNAGSGRAGYNERISVVLLEGEAVEVQARFHDNNDAGALRMRVLCATPSPTTTEPTAAPTLLPTTAPQSAIPTGSPSGSPSGPQPTIAPTKLPTVEPTSQPSLPPSTSPTMRGRLLVIRFSGGILNAPPTDAMVAQFETAVMAELAARGADALPAGAFAFELVLNANGGYVANLSYDSEGAGSVGSAAAALSVRSPAFTITGAAGVVYTAVSVTTRARHAPTGAPPGSPSAAPTTATGGSDAIASGDARDDNGTGPASLFLLLVLVLALLVLLAAFAWQRERRYARMSSPLPPPPGLRSAQRPVSGAAAATWSNKWFGRPAPLPQVAGQIPGGAEALAAMQSRAATGALELLAPRLAPHPVDADAGLGDPYGVTMDRAASASPQGS